MPIQAPISPLSTTDRSSLNISNLIDFLRALRREDSLKIADALNQIQQAIYNLERTVKQAAAFTGDSIKITDATGALGLTLASGTITITAGGFTVTITPTIIDVGTEYRVAGTKVMGARQTGWVSPTATQLRASLANGATLVQVTEFLSALITDLINQGVIGA